MPLLVVAGAQLLGVEMMMFRLTALHSMRLEAGVVAAYHGHERLRHLG